MKNKEKIKEKLGFIESFINSGHTWNHSSCIDVAQKTLKEIKALLEEGNTEDKPKCVEGMLLRNKITGNIHVTDAKVYGDLWEPLPIENLIHLQPIHEPVRHSL